MTKKVREEREIEMSIGDYHGKPFLWLSTTAKQTIKKGEWYSIGVPLSEFLTNLHEMLSKKEKRKKPKKRPRFYALKRILRSVRWKRKFRFYLAGPISYVTDDSYMTWRVMMEEFLKSIGHEGINPLQKYAVAPEEKRKVEDSIRLGVDKVAEQIENPAVDEHSYQRKVDKSVWRGEVDMAREYLRRRILNPDIELLEQSDGVIAYVPNYSVGTSSEMFYAYEHNMPVYVMTTLPRSKWSGWLVGLSTLIFTSWEDMKRFLKYMAEKGV